MSPHLPTAERIDRVTRRSRPYLVAVADLPSTSRPEARQPEARPDWSTSIDLDVEARRDAMADHPSVGGASRRRHLALVRDETGSLVAEYGLLMVLGATVTMLATKWATGGAIWQLFGSVLSKARALVGA